MRKIHFAIVSAILFIILPSLTIAQSTVVFQVDMHAQIKDSTFIPAKQTVEISGDQLPFSKTRTIRMSDKTPMDSIYTAKVHFPSFTGGQTLNYHFFIKKNGKNINENNNRDVKLMSGDKKLPIVGFNEVGG